MKIRSFALIAAFAILLAVLIVTAATVSADGGPAAPPVQQTALEPLCPDCVSLPVPPPGLGPRKVYPWGEALRFILGIGLFAGVIWALATSGPPKGGSS